MPELLSFFTIILAGLFFSHIFNRLHLPWVVALIIAGIVIGPAGFNVYQPDPTFELLGEIGLIFLMFMAGLETRFTSFDEIKHDVLPIFLLNSIIPFVIFDCIQSQLKFFSSGSGNHIQYPDWGSVHIELLRLTTIDYGDGLGDQAGAISGNTCTGSNAYAEAGVYAVVVTVTDKDGGSGSAEYRFVVVYDPQGGFVTGGGWIYSDPGNYVPDPELEGKAWARGRSLGGGRSLSRGSGRSGSSYSAPRGSRNNSP